MRPADRRLWPYMLWPICPRCGHDTVGSGRYCEGPKWWRIFGNCRITALDHLHYECGYCGFRHARVCADVEERIRA